MFRRIFSLTVLLVALSSSVYAQRPDFNGTWDLDNEASSITSTLGLAGLRSAAPARLYVQQTSDETLILSSRLPGSSARSYEFDGQSWLPAIDGDPTKILVSSRVRGLSLISVGGGRVDGEIVSVQETLTMGRYGRVLTLRVTTTRPSGAETNLLVYRRAGGD